MKRTGCNNALLCGFAYHRRRIAGHAKEYNDPHTAVFQCLDLKLYILRTHTQSTGGSIVKIGVSAANGLAYVEADREALRGGDGDAVGGRVLREDALNARCVVVGGVDNANARPVVVRHQLGDIHSLRAVCGEHRHKCTPSLAYSSIPHRTCRESGGTVREKVG